MLVTQGLNMPTETDPLLPQGNSAPEITGYGFSKPSSHRVDLVDDASQSYYEVRGEQSTTDKGTEDGPPEDRIQGGPSPFRTFAGLFVVVVAVALVIVVLTPAALDMIIGDHPNWSPWAPKAPASISDRVAKVLSSTPLIDGHNDLAIVIRGAYRNKIYGKNFASAFESGGMVSQVDLPRLKAGHVGGSFWSAYTPCLADGTNFDNDAIHSRSVMTTLSQIDLLNRLVANYPTSFASPLLNSTTALTAFKDHQILISPIGIEGLHQIGHSLANLRLYHTMGVKYATLTHNCYNNYADPALVQSPDWRTIESAKPYWNGLSAEGITAVREMNRIGMLVDLSHVSKATMLDVLGGTPSKLAGSRAPVIFSHSSAYALCPHPRNVPDDVLKLVRKTGSVLMVTLAPDFISCVGTGAEMSSLSNSDGEVGVRSGLPVFYEKNATLAQVARHVVYIGDLIGYDHVGIGSDFDGIPAGPRGLEDVSMFPELIGELLRKGVSDKDAAKIAGGNVLRVWGKAESVALEMQSEGVLPAEDDIDELK